MAGKAAAVTAVEPAVRRSPLESAFARGELHTVRVCFSDHHAGLRGRRIAAESFLHDPAAPHGFCDGALIWDIQCWIFETPPFSNFQTGYPDMHVHPDAASARLCGWSPGEGLVLCDCRTAAGEPIELDPRHVLRSVAGRAAAETRLSFALDFRLDPEEDPRWRPGGTAPFFSTVVGGLSGSGLRVLALQPLGGELVRLTLAPDAALAAADAAVIAKSAVKEIAAQHARRITFMPRAPWGRLGSALEVAVTAPPASDTDALAGRLADLWPLLRPSANAYKRGEAAGAAPPLAAIGDRLICTAASADANPYLAGAALLAAVHADAPPSGPAEPPATLDRAADRFEAAAWIRDWLGEEFVVNTVAIARWEAEQGAQAVSSWDYDRYARYA